MTLQIDETDRDMIERGDRIGAALVRGLLAHYDEAKARIAHLEATLHQIADEPEVHTKINEVRLCCKFQDIANQALTS